MTIAICLKVNDGIVLAADSATSLIGRDKAGRQGVVNIYNNANKISNLRKGLPIGAITWGAGSIGPSSIATLMKDLRSRFSGGNNDHKEWEINSDTYTVEEVAKKVKEFLFDELYVPEFRQWKDDDKPALGMIIAGFGANDVLAHDYRIQINKGKCTGPELLRKTGESGLSWGGEPEAISRLLMGFGTGLPVVLEKNLSVPKGDVDRAMKIIASGLQAPLVNAAMPIQDAIDLAEFLVDTTIKFSRFTPGAPTVGGPIEIAAITKHEGYKWVKRKHYFSRDLNP